MSKNSPLYKIGIQHERATTMLSGWKKENGLHKRAPIVIQKTKQQRQRKRKETTYGTFSQPTGNGKKVVNKSQYTSRVCRSKCEVLCCGSMERTADDKQSTIS